MLCRQSSAFIYFPIPANLLSQMLSIKMFYLIQGELNNIFILIIEMHLEEYKIVI